jgi:phasin
MEIPGAVREMAEKNLDQMRSAYEQFMDMTRKSQEMVAQSQGAMTQSALEIQARAMRFAQENMESGFKLAGELARARDVKEYLDIQTRHAQRQMQTYAEQAQELGRMMAEAAQKAQPKG